MADISKAKLPNGNIYNLKDAQARQDIETIKTLTASGVSYVGTTTTALTDGSTVSSITIKNGSTTKTLTATEGMMANYNNVMYCWNGSQWDQLGAAGALKALAYKDSVTGTFTPSGTIDAPVFSGNKEDISVTGTPSGTISAPVFTGTATDISVSGTPSGTITVTPDTDTIGEITGVGSLPAWTANVSDETLVFSWDAGSLPTKEDTTVVTGASATFTGTSTTSTGKITPSGTVSTPIFTGAKMTASGSVTPSGMVSAPTFNGVEATIESN